MKISNNIDFFNQDQVPATHLVTEHKQEEKPVEMSAQNHAVKFSDYAEALIEKTKTTLQEIGLNALTEAVDRIEKDATKERFVISVVGEFSRGKSTFLNRLLDNAPMLPVGNLPTTAILTRIRYSAKPRIAVFDEKGNRQFVKDLRPEVWEGLTVNVVPWSWRPLRGARQADWRRAKPHRWCRHRCERPGSPKYERATVYSAANH